MNVTEVRIGNLFQWKSTGKIESVKDIKTAGVKYHTINNVYISDCQPIPLTEEWLVKFGCIQVDLFGDFHGEKPMSNYIPENADMFDFVISVYEDDTIYLTSHGITWGIDIIHVHQFQNLYFALTGQELEIK